MAVAHPLFKALVQELTRFGSHDLENEREILKRKEFENVKELLGEIDCTIEEVNEDGNCLFRAVSRWLYGDSEKYREVKKEIIAHIIAHKSFYSVFEPKCEIFPTFVCHLFSLLAPNYREK